MTFSFPLPPNLANNRVHWRRKNADRKAYLLACDTLQAAGLLPPPPRTPMDRVTIRIALVLPGRMDDDNALARCKWPIDWLHTRGYIVDDRQPHCHLTIPKQTQSRLSPRAEISVSPLTADE